MKILAFLISVVLIVTSGAFAQTNDWEQMLSIHRLEWEAHRNDPKQPSFFDPSGKGIQPFSFNLAKAAAPSKTVFGYLPDWEYTTARDYLQYDLLTHIAAFDFTVNVSGSISTPSYWPWTDVINAAHTNGVKIIMTVVNFNADDIHVILTDSGVKNTFFNNVKNLLGQYQLDGVNIDFEGLKTEDRGSILNGFMDELTQAVKGAYPEAEVSFAGPAVNWGGWDLLGLSRACDYIFIMGYAFSGGWSNNAGPTAPLTGGTYNITNTVTVQYAEVLNEDPSRLILGVPYYGCRWATASGDKRATATEFIGNPRFYQAQKEGENYGYFWDSYSQTPWYRYQIGTQWYQVWFDDARSLDLKYDLADTHHLRGVGMWALGYDRERSELWNTLRERYLPQSTPPPETPNSIYVFPGEQKGTITVRVDSVYGVDGYAVYLSTDGSSFAPAKEASLTTITIDSLDSDRLYFVLLKSFNSRGYSPFSHLLAVTTTSDVSTLLIDGFERNDKGTNTFRFLQYHASGFWANGTGFASATNYGLQNGLCAIDSFTIVDWMLGNEGSNDFTFNEREKTLVRQFLENGGRLLVSGSEVGWDLVAKGSPDDRAFYRDYLKASYVNDAPLGRAGIYYRALPIPNTIFDGLAPFYYDNGTHGTYDVRWPDAILPVDGSTLGLQFDGVSTANGGCGVYYAGTFGAAQKTGKLAYLSFPLETVYSASARNDLLDKILKFFNESVNIRHQKPAVPEVLQIESNYPNPFNASTTLRFRNSRVMDVSLRLFTIRGREVYRKTLRHVSPGMHKFIWRGDDNSGKPLASGTYLYRIEGRINGKIIREFSGRMLLLK